VSTQTQQAGPLDVQVIARRILAVVIDYFILGLALGALFFLFSSIFPNLPLVTAVQGSPPVGLGRSLLNAALFGVALQWLLRPIYFIGLEGYGGQTLGKRIVGIKVVSESTGQVAGFGVTIKRNLPRVVLSGFLLVVYVLGHAASFGWSVEPDGIDQIETVVWWVTGVAGLIAMTVTGKNQRLGDTAAHTLVVRK
jgi:uncharacterized RDD family membrane protein YckC